MNISMVEFKIVLFELINYIYIYIPINIKQCALF